MDAISEPSRADFFVLFWRFGGGGLAAVESVGYELDGGRRTNLNLLRNFSFHDP